MRQPGWNATRSASYRANTQGQFEVADWQWDVSGAGGIWATPTELIRWADVYRTGRVGGKLVTGPENDAATGATADSRYGLGIFIAPDGTLWHDGRSGGFHTAFVVSADRGQAIAVACNSRGIEPFELVDVLGRIWRAG